MSLIFRSSRMADRTSDAGVAEHMEGSGLQLECEATPVLEPFTCVVQDLQLVHPADAVAVKFAVIGVSWGDIAAGPGCSPHNRLANELKKQIARVTFRHTGMQQALVYGDDGADIETRQALRTTYRPQGRFGEFAFFNDAARAACGEFGIELKILDTTEALPARRIILVQEPYFPRV